MSKEERRISFSYSNIEAARRKLKEAQQYLKDNRTNEALNSIDLVMAALDDVLIDHETGSG